MELEANLTEDGTDVYGKYTTLSARDILTKDLKELREAARELKLRDAVAEPTPSEAAAAADPSGTVATTPAAEPIDLASSSLRELEGHKGEILSMSWSSRLGLLATAAADGTVRIWDPSTNLVDTSVECTYDKPDDMIIGVEWSPYNPTGTNLAAITANGDLILWDSEGNLLHSTPNPSGAATLALQWCRSGVNIATGSTDGTVIVWDPSSGRLLQDRSWTLPGGAPVYDVHWRSTIELAAAGEDGCVAIYNFTDTKPMRCSKEHGIKMEEGENGTGGGGTFPGAPNAETVNMLRWDPTGRFLASAGNDMTIGIWNADDNGSTPPRLLSGHKREVVWVSWASTSTSNGNAAAAANEPALLASGSNDGSVRVWKVLSTQECSCIGVLDRHEEGITCVTWSPSGKCIAAGDTAGNVTVWDVARKQILCTLRGSGAVVDVQWYGERSYRFPAKLIVAFSGSASVVIADLPDSIN